MKATFKDVLIQALQNGKVDLQSVNRNLIEVSKSTKKKSGFIKVAVTDELTQKIMTQKDATFIFSVDGDELNEIAKKIMS